MNFRFARALAVSAALILPVFTYAADTSTDTPGEYMDDAAITAKIKATFIEDKWVKGRDVGVRTDHGVVDLTGTVDSQAESDRATALASKVKAVRAVHNNLKVVGHK